MPIEIVLKGYHLSDNAREWLTKSIGNRFKLSSFMNNPTWDFYQSYDFDNDATPVTIVQINEQFEKEAVEFKMRFL